MNYSFQTVVRVQKPPPNRRATRLRHRHPTHTDTPASLGLAVCACRGILWCMLAIGWRLETQSLVDAPHVLPRFWKRTLSIARSQNARLPRLDTVIFGAPVLPKEYILFIFESEQQALGASVQIQKQKVNIYTHTSGICKIQKQGGLRCG